MRVHSRYWRKSLRKSWLFHHFRILNKVIGFFSKCLLASAKNLITVVKTAFYFSRGTLRGWKSLTRIQDFWISLRLSGAKSLRSFGRERFGIAIRTAFYESRRTNWRNKCSKKYFIVFWVTGKVFLFLTLKNLECCQNRILGVQKDQFDRFFLKKLKCFSFPDFDRKISDHGGEKIRQVKWILYLRVQIYSQIWFVLFEKYCWFFVFGIRAWKTWKLGKKLSAGLWKWHSTCPWPFVKKKLEKKGVSFIFSGVWTKNRILSKVFLLGKELPVQLAELPPNGLHLNFEAAFFDDSQSS